MSDASPQEGLKVQYQRCCSAWGLWDKRVCRYIPSLKCRQSICKGEKCTEVIFQAWLNVCMAADDTNAGPMHKTAPLSPHLQKSLVVLGLKIVKNVLLVCFR